ncbi:MAG: nucleotidyltransferase family protein [Polaromonas sp.]|uniref:nucleotidyltransferase family protein n=1 Tax=Polaromonas sp. TaxID=1869339 RepID=UPI0017AADCF0|nr:nucleotidyltransferase family protein [Polaromonas sp.]MBA3592263.1 nucleotidyltransferase family protein [Polaromonas sp.]
MSPFSPSPPSTGLLPVVIVLGAGRGERFAASGGETHKLAALLAGQTVLDHVLAAVQASGLPHHLVRADPSRPGMGDSIAAGIRATPAAAGWLILPADLPLVRGDTLRAVAAALQQHPVAVPVYQGERGHPVGFSAACRDALLDLKGNQGAAPVVRACQAINSVALVEVDDIGSVTDIDTVEDLARAEALLAAR